jgi:hypothetical protein
MTMISGFNAYPPTNARFGGVAKPGQSPQNAKLRFGCCCGIETAAIAGTACVGLPVLLLWGLYKLITAPFKAGIAGLKKLTTH